MSNSNESKTQSWTSNLLIFFIIFFVLVAIVLTLRFSGILQSTESTSQTTEQSVQTIPTNTTVQTTQITAATTTQQATTPPATSETTETTTIAATTYPPATVPVYTTTEKPQTTVSTTAPVIDSHPEISDEAMEELIEVRYLTIYRDKNGNIPENSGRSCEKLTSIKNIVVHYVANPGTSAEQNWRYFNNQNVVSAHFIIGLDGEIIQALPLDEVAWAIGTTEGNYTSISIECCHPDSTGQFTDATYDSLVKLVSWLCRSLELERDDVVRHYDYPRYNSQGVEWHKQCPLYYANDSDPESHARWEAFKKDLILDD